MYHEVLSGACPSPWHSISTGCYYFHLGPLNWFVAKSKCEALNGALVEIETKEEQDDIFGFWIGLTDWTKEGTMVWESGREVKYTAWSPGQPDNSLNSEDCVNLWVGWNKDGLWNGARCGIGQFSRHSKSWKYGGICEQNDKNKKVIFAI